MKAFFLKNKVLSIIALIVIVGALTWLIVSQMRKKDVSTADNGNQPSKRKTDIEIKKEALKNGLSQKTARQIGKALEKG